MALNDSHASPVGFRRLAVPAALARWVQFIWMLRVDGARPLLHRVVPAGATDLVLASSGLLYHADTGQRYLEGPDVLVSGPCAGFLPLRSAGPVMMIGLRLHTGCAFSLLRVPLSELAGRCLTFNVFRESMLEKERVRTLVERLWEIRAPCELLVHVEPFLLSQRTAR